MSWSCSWSSRTPTSAAAPSIGTLPLERAAAYDSFYLALAEQLDADLWTTDLNLVRAVGKPWVKSASEV